MELSPERKQQIEEEERQRWSEEQYRAQVRENLSATASRAVPAAPARQRSHVGLLVCGSIVVLGIGGLLVFDHFSNGSISPTASEGPTQAGETTPAHPAQAAPPTNSELAGLQGFVGKYPFELLRTKIWIERRLGRILGSNRDRFESNFAVQTPIRREGDYLVLRGCRPHDCPSGIGIVAVSLRDGKLHASLYTESGRENFSEDLSGFPTEVLRSDPASP